MAFALIKTEGLDDAGRARVQREGQAMGRLVDNPHIVPIDDLGEEGEQPYFVSQFMPEGDEARRCAALIRSSLAPGVAKPAYDVSVSSTSAAFWRG